MKVRGTLVIYFVEDEGGMITGRLVERAFTLRRFVAIGATLDAIRAELARDLDVAVREDGDVLDPFLWEEPVESARVIVEVRPTLMVEKRAVIGKETIPLVLTYAYTPLRGENKNSIAGYRVVLPRFGWWYVLEDLALAPEVLREAVGHALAGETPRSLLEFRAAKAEFFEDFRPKLLSRRRRGGEPDAGAFSELNQVAEDWTKLARAGKLGAHGGQADDERYRALLRLEKRPSLLLVGPSGVGKTAWVKELARRAARPGASTAPLRVWATSAERILAGMAYLGMWEQRCLDIVAELHSEGDYLYVDRLAALTRVRSGGSSIADLFLPALQEGAISWIAECTEHEYERLLGASPALLACFEVQRLEPPTLEAMSAWIFEYQERYPDVGSFHPDGVRALVHKLALFRRDHAFPGKACAFLDWLRQERRGNRPEALASLPSQASLSALGRARPIYGPRDAERLFARYSGLPEKLVSDDELGPPEVLAEVLARGVVGQDAACRACAEVLTRFKAGLSDPEKPIGSLLFAGPTGVGKTELAKQLARFMFGSADRMLRFDMSEYMLPGSIHRLLSDEKGDQSLAQRVSEQPLSLVLFDEIEKAHPAVFDLLLAVLGEGRLTTHGGRLIDFRMTLIVMTSNLGVSGERPGFGRTASGAGEALAAVRQHFRPEFFNRLDHVVPFEALGPEAIRRIVDLELDAAGRREGLARRGIRLRVSLEARALLAELGFHPKYGARPLKRAVEERVLTPLAIELARRPKLSGIEVRIERSDSELRLVFPG